MNWLVIVEIVQQAHLQYAVLRMALFSDWFGLYFQCKALISFLRRLGMEENIG